MSEVVVEATKKIIASLVLRKYEAIEALTLGTRLTAASIEEAIRAYGRTLMMPPRSAYDALDVVPIKDASGKRWSVRMHLWTQEEGRSDLVVELMVSVVDARTLIELNDIHVI